MIPGTKPGARGALQRERWRHPWFERGWDEGSASVPGAEVTGVTSLVRGQGQRGHPQILGAAGKRGMKDLPEGLGLLVLQRHRRPPWGPGNGKKGNVGGIVGTKHPWGQGWGTGGTAQGMGTPWEGRPALPWFPIFLFPPSLFSLSLPKTPSLGPALQGQPHLDPAGIPLESCWNPAGKTHLRSLLAGLSEGAGAASVSLRGERKSVRKIPGKAAGGGRVPQSHHIPPWGTRGGSESHR